MEQFVYLAVLCAAACHAGWNALLKLRLDPSISTTLLAIACGVVALPFALVLGIPDAAAWPYLIGSTIIHVGYFVTLAAAYRHGDLGQVYPIARGTAPLLTALPATFWLGERLGPFGWTGIIVLASGILLLALKGGRTRGQFNARAVGFGLATSLTIMAYTLIDGLGARASSSAWGYTAWFFVMSGAAMAAYSHFRHGPRLVADFAANWRIALGGATLATTSYAVAIWAMTVAPIALVAALRETSVLFAALFGALLLREPLYATRIAAAVLVLAGVLLVRLR